MASNPLFVHDLYDRVVVDKRESSCCDARKVINSWLLVTKVTVCEKVYIAC
jgi:hypothetical protein